MDKIFNEITSGASNDGTITFTVTDLKCAIYERKKELCMARKNVNSETPFNDWMYDYFVKALPDEYIVTSRKENIKNLGKVILPEEINEYACSKSDLVIRKDKLVPSDMIKCCVVSIVEDDRCNYRFSGGNKIQIIQSLNVIETCRLWGHPWPWKS